MFLFLFFLLSMNCAKADFDHFAARDDMHWNDQFISVTYKAEVISEKEYPKSRIFLQNLIQKYPKEFEGVSFYMARNFSPFAGCGIIGIPYEWLIKLEAEIPVAQQWIEWALLHEAGHIHHQHVKVYSYFNIGQVISLNIGNIAYGLALGMNIIGEEETKKIYGENISANNMLKIGFIGFAGMVASILGLATYSKYISEPQADDFAAEKCQSKEALEAGAVWLDKVSLDNAMYPSVQDRVEKINKAIEKRFKNI